MPSVALYNIAGQEIGTVKLSDEIFAQEVNQAVLHTVVRAYLANQRQGTQSALTRAEVRGPGGKRAPVARARVPPARPSGGTAAWSSPPSPGITASALTKRSSAWP